jgi:eukaryotic-like serine/threonine-protein kinase
VRFLYEMLTGRKAFEGRSQSSVIAAIMHVDPPGISVLKPMTPPALDRVVKVCLAKDPDERWQTAHDLALQFVWIGEGEFQASFPPRARPPKLWFIVAAVSLFSAIVLAGGMIYEHRSASEAVTVRFTISSPDKTVFEAGAEYGLISTNGGGISPNGRKLAFTAKDESGKVLLWVRSLDTLAAQSLSGTDGAYHPFWSPDSRTIAFFAQGKLKKIWMPTISGRCSRSESTQPDQNSSPRFHSPCSIRYTSTIWRSVIGANGTRLPFLPTASDSSFLVPSPM